jgi:NAD(P)-dependent dehydrogenase (short-subunit alcohol dehydrogenase family)
LVRTRSLRRKKILLKDMNAVIYGGGGSIGGAVARAFAREGANVFLAGRTRAKLEEVSDEIRSSGSVAETAQVDALDGRAVDRHADAVADEGEAKTWCKERNRVGRSVDWRFRTEDARIKLGSLYPSTEE